MASDVHKFIRLVEKLSKSIKEEVDDRLPRKLGVLAVQHFKQNFRDSGFRNGGLQPWKRSLREVSGDKRASSRYKTLTSARNHLMNSTESVVGKGYVSIVNSVPYASIHNEGGTIHQNIPISQDMRKFAWAMFFKSAGIRKGKKSKGATSPENLSPEALKWRGLALTKKSTLSRSIQIPKRQFIGESQELTELVTNEIEQTIDKVRNGVSSL